MSKTYCHAHAVLTLVFILKSDKSEHTHNPAACVYKQGRQTVPMGVGTNMY